MTENQNPCADDLTQTWRRYDWRESLFAPGLVILQALTIWGKTASGAGQTREEAYARCLAETAEHCALEAQDTKDFQSGNDGIAAHPDPMTARQLALLEAVERQVIGEWWQGQLPARQLSPAWLAAQGLAGEVMVQRKGASQKRRTQWWQVETSSGPCVMICRGTSRSGQDPILGYGCGTDARAAAGKALREMLLMELNLMEVMAARSGPETALSRHAQQRIRAFAQHGAMILPQDRPMIPRFAHGPPAEGLCCEDITPPDCALSVWRCRATPATPTDPNDTPFL